MSFNFDETWDEFQWQAHLDELEKRNEKLRSFIDSALNENRPRWFRFLEQYNSKLDAINAYIEEELLIEESYFPEDEDLDEDDDDLDDPFFDELDDFDDQDGYEGDDEGDLFDDSEEDFDDDPFMEEGEEWKSMSDEYTMSDSGSLENLQVYIDARNLGAELLNLAEGEPLFSEDKTFVHFITNTLNISTKIAAGYSFGFDREVLGANIVYTKKALYHANHSLEMLYEWQHRHRLMSHERYLETHRKLHELRNNIGIYVQELRNKFYMFL